MKQASPGVPPLIDGLSAVEERYDGLLVDLWGCLHDGLEASPAAVDALVRFRGRGGRVVLLSNAPRTAGPVRRQLEAMGVPEAAWDAIMTAGMAVRLEIEERSDPWFAALGRRFYHVGTEQDAALLDGLDHERVASVENADFVLCCGIRHDGESLGDIAPELEQALAGGLPMVSCNPDRFVLRGATMVICAGEIAAAYAGRGGDVRQEGKPFPAVYRRCRNLLGNVPADRVLALGDGIETDILGARDAGLDSVWITGGLPAHFWGVESDRPPPQDLVMETCARHGVAPLGVMPRLAW